VIQRRNERLQMMQAAAQENHQKRQAAAAQRQMRMAQVEASLDRMQAKFTDDSVALEYDADRLNKKFGFQQVHDDIDKESVPLPCLGPRAHWIDCQKKFAPDNRPCNFYVQALEECVRQTIGKTTIEK